jgi:hypothetical protein
MRSAVRSTNLAYEMRASWSLPLLSVVLLLLRDVVGEGKDDFVPNQAAVRLTVFHVDKSGTPTAKQWMIEYDASNTHIKSRCKKIAKWLEHRKFSDPDLPAYEEAMQAANGKHPKALASTCVGKVTQLMADYQGKQPRQVPTMKKKPQKRIEVLLKKCSKGRRDEASCQAVKDPVQSACCLLALGKAGAAAQKLGPVVAQHEKHEKQARPSGPMLVEDPSYAYLYMGVAMERAGAKNAWEAFKKSMYHFARAHTYSPEMKVE